MNATRPRLVDDYLSQLDRSLADLPSARRKEIVADIEEHIDQQLSELSPAPSDSEIRNLLDRVGNPDELADDARDRFEITPASPRWTDYAALVLLPLGGFVVLGWFLGVAFLWSSNVWSRRDKLLGTLIAPGGVTPSLYLLIAPSDQGASTLQGLLGLFFLLGPIAMAIYLASRLARAKRSDASHRPA